MADVVHLGDEVEFITDAFGSAGAPRGTVGVVVDDWADVSNDIQITDSKTGEFIARVRAAADDVKLYTGEIRVTEPREHGFPFGRGDDLGARAGDPPSATPSQFGGMPGSSSGLRPLAPPPPEGGELVEDIPWELRDEPPSGPIFH